MALGQGRLGKRLESWAFPKERYPGRIHICMEWIRHDLNPGAIVLDCGAGKGKTQYSLGNKVHKIVGIDLSEEVLTNPLLDEAYVCDACRTPFNNDTFDAIFALMVLEHIEHAEPFLREMLKILKPGGSFYFITPNSNHYFVMVSRAMPEPLARLVQKLRGLPVEEHFPTFYRLNSPRRLTEYASKVGFGKIELRFYEGTDIITYCPTMVKLPAILYTKLVNRSPLLTKFVTAQPSN